jgi:two-component system, NarL family, nitrate/nitrite response regulator NarL
MVGDSEVLVVDPDHACRTHVSQLLRRVGYQTVEVDTGEAALRVARTRPLSLVLLELVLPEATGYEVCRELREELDSYLPIIFLTGARTDSLDRVAGLLLGADDYIVKPFDPDELIARVLRLADRHPLRRPRPRTIGLTPRESEVLALLADGLRQPEIARRLYISPRTVGKHIEHILAKLGVHSRTEAVAHVARNRLA